ncbi:adenylate/guanylate cyclase domain-containing protein [Aurantiacibacter sp. MUD11]|uniref:adenylate/guanylate cyclase domain-containing protein n=1 Tax=Aurantiacibacter sp. MUD11 TaxID=3003265 RepID=UPI0022AA0D43|nr:adenylate/guanylate cyclase domain-containing protein [Aurantiacibacter sp. MUD11]WAT16826.1 adenylate/guanylate cyclase domain-containing protein [Aurantiacibacter sp. MUD11]
MRLFTAGWRKVGEAGPRRLLITAMLLIVALLLARFSWSLPFTDTAERALYDYRAYSLAEQVEQDERILMVVYNDQTLIQLEKRSPLDRGLLADALANIDQMGAKAIGIDILFDQPQSEDAQLLETLQNMQTPTRVAYAETETNELDIIYDQQQYLDAFMAELEGTNSGPASVRLTATSGVTRLFPTIEEGIPPLLGRSMLMAAGEPAVEQFEGYEGAIRYRLPAVYGDPALGEEPTYGVPNYTVLTIDLFANPDIAPGLASVVEGRYVLIGGDIVDYDRALTPFSAFNDPWTEQGGRSVNPAGMEIHADTIAQMLDGVRLKQVDDWAVWALAFLTVVAAALTALLELKSWRVVPLLVAQVAIFIGLPFFLHAHGVDTHGFPAFGPALGWVVAFTGVTSAARAATAVQRQFAQGALGKYLPQSIADEIIEKPELLSLGGEKREIYVLFSDLEGFTKMSHAIAPEMVAKLLNRYLEMLSDVVLEHGGILDKFIGDAVVAFWGAPISRPDDGERAARCGYAIWQAGEAFRKEVEEMDPTLPKIGKTRVGLHFGEAVVGNFGGENRIQYTALGDSMNTAARMESGNKAFKSSIMATGEFATRSGLDWWRRMGRVVLSGRSSPVDLYEPAPDFPEADRKALAKANELLDTDRDKGLEMLQEIAARHPEDEALQALLARSHDLNEAGAHVLGSK